MVRNIRVPVFEFFKKKPTLADENRIHFRDQQWRGIRKKVIIQTAAGGIAFMLWFLACLSYLYGTLYLSPNRNAAFHVLAVDYDGGVVGQTMQAAYEQLKGPGFFTLVYRSPGDYATVEDMYKAVWNGDYWAAISASEGASARLSAALQGGNAAATYDPSGALHYIWNQQYYTTFANSIILGHMNTLVAAIRLVYNNLNGTQASQFLNETDPAAVRALLNPIQASTENIKPAQFGTVMLMNTVSMAMPVLQQFFFLLVLNGVLGAHNLYEKMTVRSSLLLRRIAGLLFTFGAALCQTGYYWAFREDWDVNGKQFLLTWMTFWLLMHIHLLILDSISTLAPLPVMPFVVLLWVLLNIASTLSPLEGQANFYHWMVALPSHEAYSILVTIWTGGAHNRLYRALPILFAWWLVANVTTSLTHIRACHLAYRLEEEQRVDLEDGKDVEDGLAAGNNREDAASLQHTLTRNTTRLERQRTAEDIALERRQVYGPSIPPFA
ncbi:Nn.00g113670.m01.CDS01 [Neocucurbitaria sp. VM-36]